MTAVIRDKKIILSGITLLMLCTSQAYAACSREDVQFYLDKGFSTEQITELCKSAPDAKPAEDQVQQKEQDSSKQQVDSAAENEQFLKTAIKGKDIGLDDDTLYYTLRACIEYGEEDLFGFTPKACPDVKYVISLKGLEVLGDGRKYGFWGPKEVRVRSKISFEILGNLKDTKPEDRELIVEKLDQGDKTGIPIRSDIDLDRVQQVLLQLAE